MQNEFDNMTLKDFENRGQDLLPEQNRLMIIYRIDIESSIYLIVSSL